MIDLVKMNIYIKNIYLSPKRVWQTTRESTEPQPASQIVPQTLFRKTSTRPSTLLYPPESRTGIPGKQAVYI